MSAPVQAMNSAPSPGAGTGPVRGEGVRRVVEDRLAGVRALVKHQIA